VIRYRHGVLSGRGASLLDGYMEDLATDRIYRLMIAQRVLHRDHVAVLDEAGQPAAHTPELITKIFDEELQHILDELPADTTAETRERFAQARISSERMIVESQFNPS
jgi:malate synthase